MNQVLFLCSGNYFRSRVSEILFNHLATTSLPDWKADSRGFEVGSEVSKSPADFVSPLAIQFFTELGIKTFPPRVPLLVKPTDLFWSDRIIALDEGQHRPIIESRFPQWAMRTEYWNVPSVNESNWSKTIPRLEANIYELISVIKSEQALCLQDAK